MAAPHRADRTPAERFSNYPPTELDGPSRCCTLSTKACSAQVVRQETWCWIAAGALLGTRIENGGNAVGNIFKLTHQSGTWTYTDLHDFTPFDDQDGEEPVGTPILDANGNLDGTTLGGGSQECSFEVQCGTVWKLTPQ